MVKEQPIQWLTPKGNVKSTYPPKDTTKNQIYSALVHLKSQLINK